VLLLGDSFSNIYSLAPMGWGEGAGFAEHLSAALGSPLDAILRNSDGAFATRQTLQRELAAGRDRLREKKVVVWEFAVRELTHGDWRPLAMELGTPLRGEFYSPSSGAPQRIEGIVAGISSIPRPGAVPYREHVVTLHLVDVKHSGAAASSGRECLVYTWSMREQALTEAARLRPGDSVAMEVQSWEEVSAAKEKFQRSELDDPSLVAEPYCWSDFVSRTNAADGAAKP
jgi:alginate O-acetyltransferase complex protein AlgJ